MTKMEAIKMDALEKNVFEIQVSTYLQKELSSNSAHELHFTGQSSDYEDITLSFLYDWSFIRLLVHSKI